MPPSALIGRGCPLTPAARCGPATARDERRWALHEWRPGSRGNRSVEQATARCGPPTTMERKHRGHSGRPALHAKRQKAGLHARHNTHSRPARIHDRTCENAHDLRDDGRTVVHRTRTDCFGLKATLSGVDIHGNGNVSRRPNRMREKDKPSPHLMESESWQSSTPTSCPSTLSAT